MPRTNTTPTALPATTAHGTTPTANAKATTAPRKPGKPGKPTTVAGYLAAWGPQGTAAHAKEAQVLANLLVLGTATKAQFAAICSAPLQVLGKDGSYTTPGGGKAMYGSWASMWCASGYTNGATPAGVPMGQPATWCAVYRGAVRLGVRCTFTGRGKAATLQVRTLGKGSATKARNALAAVAATYATEKAARKAAKAAAAK